MIVNHNIMTSMEENYAVLLQLPIVSKLLKRNAKLRKENKALKSLIYSLPEFRCVSRSNTSSNVDIKQEKDDSIPVQCDTLEEDDEVVFVAPENNTKKINIVYEIDEEDEAQASEEDNSEEDAEEETAEEEEEEEEEATEEADAQASEAEQEAEEEEEEEEEEEAAQASEADDEEAEEEAEEEAQASEAEEEEEAEEVFVVTVSGKSYYTTNKENGKIYAIDADEEIGDEVGEFKAGKAKFHKK